jgi:hypothetical protein
MPITTVLDLRDWLEDRHLLRSSRGALRGFVGGFLVGFGGHCCTDGVSRLIL